MKTIYSKTIYVFLLMLLITDNTYAQGTKQINEECTADADCASGLYCVKVNINGSATTRCCKCNQYALDGYTAEVDAKCKNRGKGMLGFSDLKSEFGSKNEVSLMELKSREEACKECLYARTKRESECWNGGDAGHLTQINDLKDAINYLDGIINEKTRNKLAYYCDDSNYDNYKRKTQDYCKDVKSMFDKNGLYKEEPVNCSDIETLISNCKSCKEALDNLKYYCFKDGLPEKLIKDLGFIDYKDVEDMITISTETLNKSKSNSLCK